MAIVDMSWHRMTGAADQKVNNMGKSWWCWIYRGPVRGDKYAAGITCELPGGKDDAGLMESDLMLLFKDLIDLAHEDLSKEEIQGAFLTALEDRVTNLGNCVAVSKKK